MILLVPWQQGTTAMARSVELTTTWTHVFSNTKSGVRSHVAWCLQLYKLQSALREAGVTMYGGERASRDLSLERAKSDRCAQPNNC